MKRFTLFAGAAIGLFLALLAFQPEPTVASSHREAPLISNDPLADNTDLYAFRSPDDPNAVTIIANYIPFELPEGGPNYVTFGEDIRYEIHIKNRPSTGALGSARDNITYRFTFRQINEDPTTFFNIRLGKQNLKTTYTCEKSVDGGVSFSTIISNGPVPPNNIGPRSIEGAAGLGMSYDALVSSSIRTATTGEVVFCGPRDDPFFVDLGGVFDLGGTRSSFGADPGNPANTRDAVAGFNTHTIAMKIPINKLQKSGKSVSQATSILDPDFVIGVWASASRKKITILQEGGTKPVTYGPWIQVSRLGMPLTNEAVIPLGEKDRWNYYTPYDEEEQSFWKYFANPELALYMDDAQFGGAVPSLSALRIQSQSYPAIGTLPGYSTPGFDFRNGKDGVYALTALNPPPDLSGTAFAANIQPRGLFADNRPRLVDIFPIFYFGVPNAIPYQLATGKTGGPLSAGKPFIHNFLPVLVTASGKLYGGDMLRLNMATPVTNRSTTEFTSNARMGLVRAAVLGLTDPTYNGTRDLQDIPHMDGFPNGRRLEDDVTTIELQAVGGLVLAAVGLPFDDAVAGDYSDLASPKLVNELTYLAGPVKNDLSLLASFPYLANPHRGYDYVKQLTAGAPAAAPSMNTVVKTGGLGISVPAAFLLDQNFPNPFNPTTEIRYHVASPERVTLKVYNTLGQEIETLADGEMQPGNYSARWDASKYASGTYLSVLAVGNNVVDTKKMLLVK